MSLQLERKADTLFVNNIKELKADKTEFIEANQKNMLMIDNLNERLKHIS